MITERYGRTCPPPSDAKRSPKTGTGRWNAAASGRAPTGARPVVHAMSVPTLDGDDAARQMSLESHAAEIGQQHDAQRDEADDRVRERPEQEAERDEAQGDAGKRREKRCARRGLAHALGDERRRELDDPRHERREQARLPGDARRIRGARLFGERLRRQHHEKDVREERDRVDAVGQRADVAAARARREPSRLERVGDVADENRDRGGRQDAPVDELGRKAEHAAAQRVDEEKLNEIVEGEPEEAVDVAANDPTHAESIAAVTAPARSARADDEVHPSRRAVDRGAHPGAGHLRDDDAFRARRWPTSRRSGRPRLTSGGSAIATVGMLTTRVSATVASDTFQSPRCPTSTGGSLPMSTFALDLHDARAKARRRLHLSGGSLCPPQSTAPREELLPRFACA